MTTQIQTLFDRSRGTYGSPRIHRGLTAAGLRVSCRRVARLMREAGLRAPRVARLLHEHLKIAGLWRYLAVVMDRYSRRVIGWSLGATRDARLMLAALNRAVRNRRPRPGVIFHTDRGIEYAAYTSAEELSPLLRSYIPYYKGVRPHSGIGYRSPIDYEAQTR